MLSVLKRKYINLVSDDRFSEILTGSVWALSGRVIATALGLAFSVLVARLYGAEMVGIVAVVNAFLLLATILTVFGTEISILRLIPEHISKYSPTSAHKVYCKIKLLVIAFSLASGVLFFLMADIIADRLFSKPHLSFYFALASVFIVFQSIMRLNTQAVRGLRLVRAFALMQVLPQSFNLLFLIIAGFFWSTQDVPVYAVLLGFAATGITGWFIMEYNLKKMMRPDDIIHPMPIRAILSLSTPMLMTTSINFLIAQAGVIMLGMFRTEADVGYYAIAVKLATLSTFVIQAVNSMAGPKFSELFYSGKSEELFHIAKKSTKLIFLTTAPILFGLIFFGKPILSYAFGSDFAVAYPAMTILVFGELINTITGLNGMFLNMTGHQNVLKNIMAAAALLNITLNLCLIPKLGFNGAAIATAVSLCFWKIISFAYIKIKFKKHIGYFPLILNSRKKAWKR